MPQRSAVLDDIVKAYDIRGLVPDQLDADLARDLGAAAAVELVDPDAGSDRRALVIGHDMRPSSPELVTAFAQGVTSRGVDVVLIGLASTDMLYFASGLLGLPGAMFTASHNPGGYNGVKLCRSGARPVSLDDALADIRDAIAAGEQAAPPAASGMIRRRELLEEFAAHVRSFVDESLLAPVALAIDAGNGMAGYVVPPVFDPLPFEVHPLFFELDGTFPNHLANPLEPANLRDLQALVREREEVVLGLAFDGDADRMFAVDEQGEPVASSLVGAVVADRLLDRNPGAVVLHNLICSKTVPETVEAAGGQAVRTRVGHSFVKQQMAETDAVFAVEHSGHYYFRDNYRADSGLIAALLLLEAVAVAGKPLSEVVAPYDRYAASGEINFEVDDQQAALDAVETDFAGDAELDRLDGLTVETGDGWFNLRPSNTEPLLRLNVEADGEAAVQRLRGRVAATVTAA